MFSVFCWSHVSPKQINELLDSMCESDKFSGNQPEILSILLDVNIGF